jgi:hypothetical protein
MRHGAASRNPDVPITYELGDNTDRTLLRQVSVGAAQEMMTLLLAARHRAN